MSEDDFYNTSPRYFTSMVKAKNDQMKESWIQARQIGYWAILPHTGKKRIKPTDLGRFGWEESKFKGIQVTEAELKKQAELMLAMFEANTKRIVN